MASKIAQAKTADDMLTVLAATEYDARPLALASVSLKVLRTAADLCGTDSTDMSKRDAIDAILASF